MELELREIPGEVFAHYRAGSDGHIYSIKSGTGSKASGRPFKIKGYVNPLWKYIYVSIYHNKQCLTFRAHKLICLAFHGFPELGQECRHLDGNRQNNVPSNLKWGTRQENADDRVRHGTSPVGEKNPASKLTDAQRDEIVKALLDGTEDSVSAGKKYGVTSAAIQFLARNRNVGLTKRVLTKIEISAIRAQHALGIKNCALAALFSVSQTTIGRVIRGESYFTFEPELSADHAVLEQTDHP